MAAHTALGGLLAIRARPEGAAAPWVACALGVVIWVVLLNGGTLAINSAFDHDEGDVAYLRRPPAAPPHLFGWGLGLMLLGLALAWVLMPRGYTVVYAACFVLSILYSVPPWRLKAVAGADWAINLVGFGALTPLAGWLAAGVRPTAWAWLLVTGFGLLFAALYPLTQLYQADEDRRRGDRTLALRLGARVSLATAVAATIAAFVLFGLAGFRTGWTVGAWRLTLLLVPFAGWLLVLLPWLAGARGWSARQHQRSMYLALGAWALTDVAIGVSWLT